MRFLADKRLYTETDRCLEWLRQLPGPSADATQRVHEQCHLYWHGAIGPKQTFAVKSFLATQDREHLALTLWLDAADGFDDHERSTLLAPLLPYLRVLPFDPEEQSRGTPLEGRLDLYRNPGATARSNFARLTILHNCGGIYADADTMFMRDLHGLPHDVLSRDEFCSQWSSHVRSGNNAILRLQRGSPTVRALMERAVAESSCRPRAILAYEGGESIDLLVLPSALFDPLWAHHDRMDQSARVPFERFEDFFSGFGFRFRRKRWVRSVEDFFPGAFTYHWHNCWNAVERRNSYFGLFDRELDAILADLSLSRPQPVPTP